MQSTPTKKQPFGVCTQSYILKEMKKEKTTLKVWGLIWQAVFLLCSLVKENGEENMYMWMGITVFKT